MQSISTWVFALALLFSVKATPMDQLTQDFTSILLGCLEEFPVDVKDLEMLSNKTMPDKEVARCLFACAYKKTGAMDNDGKLNPQGLKDLTSKYFPNDANKMKMSEDFNDACLKVNDEAVSDGNKGCERAALLFKCGADNVPEFDLI